MNLKWITDYTCLVLNRTKEEGVGMEDLDKLQLELETLLSAVAVRIRELNSEITTLSTAEERKDKKGKLGITPTVTVNIIIAYITIVQMHCHCRCLRLKCVNICYAYVKTFSI